MSMLISLSINVEDFRKLPRTKNKNGDKEYVALTVAVNDTEDKFGNNCSAYGAQTKEQRQAKEPRSYCGNGKVLFSNGLQSSAQPRGQQSKPPAAVTEDMLPF